LIRHYEVRRVLRRYLHLRSGAILPSLRGSVFINTAGGAGAQISPNLAGRMAAALAVCYHTYRSSDPTYANQCLLSAEHIFDLANTAPSGNLLTAIPFSFYPEAEWRDDLELGATELYFALQGASSLPMGLPHSDGMFYLQKAAHWANAYIIGPNDAADTLNLYDVSGLAHFELYQALGLAGTCGSPKLNAHRQTCNVDEIVPTGWKLVLVGRHQVAADLLLNGQKKGPPRTGDPSLP
jgi:hypothetical protein